MLSTTEYKVELYNHWYRDRQTGAPGNGYFVARYVNGVRHETVRDYGRDEGVARMFAAHMNSGARS